MRIRPRLKPNLVKRSNFVPSMPRRTSKSARKSPTTSTPTTTKDAVVGGLVVAGVLGFLVLGAVNALGSHDEPAAIATITPIEQTDDYVAPVEPLICGVNLDCSSIDHALADKAAWAPKGKAAPKAAKSQRQQSTTTAQSGSTASTTKTTSVRTSTSKSGATSVTRTTSVKTTH